MFRLNVLIMFRRLSQVVADERPLNGRCCTSAFTYMRRRRVIKANARLCQLPDSLHQSVTLTLISLLHIHLTLYVISTLDYHKYNHP